MLSIKAPHMSRCTVIWMFFGFISNPQKSYATEDLILVQLILQKMHFIFRATQWHLAYCLKCQHLALLTRSIQCLHEQWAHLTNWSKIFLLIQKLTLPEAVKCKAPWKLRCHNIELKSAKHYPRWGAVHSDGCSTMDWCYKKTQIWVK